MCPWHVSLGVCGVGLRSGKHSSPEQYSDQPELKRQLQDVHNSLFKQQAQGESHEEGPGGGDEPSGISVRLPVLPQWQCVGLREESCKRMSSKTRPFMVDCLCRTSSAAAAGPTGNAGSVGVEAEPAMMAAAADEPEAELSPLGSDCRSTWSHPEPVAALTPSPSLSVSMMMAPGPTAARPVAGHRLPAAGGATATGQTSALLEIIPRVCACPVRGYVQHHACTMCSGGGDGAAAAAAADPRRVRVMVKQNDDLRKDQVCEPLGPMAPLSSLGGMQQGGQCFLPDALLSLGLGALPGGIQRTNHICALCTG